jgi:SAM-dependent methyltransferase
MAESAHFVTRVFHDLVGQHGIRAVALMEEGPPPVVLVVSSRPAQQTESRGWLTQIGTPKRSRRAHRGELQGWSVHFEEHGDVVVLVSKAALPVERVLVDPTGVFPAAPGPGKDTADPALKNPAKKPENRAANPASSTPTHFSARWYDLIHRVDADDVRFYLDLARAMGGPVLEIGVGSGRIAIPVARAGIDVTGLDLSEDMLAGLAEKLAAEPALQKRLHYERMDMRDFDLGRKFPLVVIPFRAFLHNLTIEDQIACLLCCRKHLAPGGELVFNVFHPSLAFMAANVDANDAVWRWIRDEDQPDGGWASLSQAIHYEPVPQHLHARQRIERFGPDGVLVDTFQFRLQLAYLYPGDLRHRLAEAGFHDVSIEGGFQGGPLTHDGDELVVRARV